MLELPLVFLGGLLGSSHCVGMCGGFALVLGTGAPTLGANIIRQLVYSGGRIFTYAMGGGALGYAGLRLAHDLPPVVQVQATFSILAGVLLIAQGLLSAGVLPNRRWRKAASGCLARGLFASFLRAPGWSSVFLAGVFTGFLPCGLVYAYLALATSAGNLLLGLLTMAAFGLGTVPLMVLTGSGASLVTLAARQRLLTVAAWCVVLTGLVSIARGLGFVDVPGWLSGTGCPLCR